MEEVMGVTVKYYWDFSIEEFQRYTSNRLLIDYFDVNKKAALQAINHLGTVPFIEIVAKLNALDEKLKLLFYFTKNAKNRFLSGLELVELIEREHRKSFEEELDVRISQDILDCSLLFISEGSTEKFLWDIDFRKSFLENEKVELSFDLLERYFNLLRFQANQLIDEIDSFSFYDSYPKLLLVDCKCATIIELYSVMEHYETVEEEIIYIVENDIKQIFYEKFTLMFFEEENYSLKTQTIIPEAIDLSKL
ncbi:hypothetical protein BFG62_07625 [Listeria monocytogenes]|nr:hypothetical protein [Listeria monocytogenes]EAK9081825.1 hypothetical protein [Listeria monocytogenes]EDP7576261.1 hypothetical protein [Listeria monocytogenes]EFS3771406.1 hypothetical protein [Listeria monocytogenes]EIT6516561.1 hypothetical protein [Listeria monocytogenes]